MQRSLVNTFLGILTTSEVHELIDIFKGKGRRKITPFLEEYLESIESEEISSAEDIKKSLFSSDTCLSGDLSEEEIVDDSASERKGVLFILDSFKRTRKYQNLLKSKEVITLYSKIKNQPISRSYTLENNTTAKSKGVLVNKKHY